MSKFPLAIDDDSTIPFINDNINEIGGEVINAERDAIINIETEIGIGASGSAGSIANRLGVSLLPSGQLRPSAIIGLGLVTLPITNDQIIANAGIPESKLFLDHKTQDLFNYIENMSAEIGTALGWISATGSKLDPHLNGTIYRHYLNHINVSAPLNYLRNKFSLLRDNSNAYTLINDINNELLAHQFADGSPFGIISNVTTHNGTTYPSNYAHTASGIFLQTGRWTSIPQTMNDVQLFADFIDNASIFLLGTRIQNLYTSGISRVSRSSSFINDGYGQPLVDTVPAIAYLLNNGTNSSPFDDISHGDDIIELKPPTSLTDNNLFDEQFALVKVGDIIRINYGTIEVPFLVKERKYIQNGLNKQYIIRIDGKNLQYSPNALARIDRSLVNSNKYGVLAISAVNNPFNETPSLIVSSPRGGEALGLGFNPDLFDNSHYMLYLAIYPTGNAKDGYTILPGIDVTGNRGATPGLYTLDSIVEATNAAFRQVGYNYRFIAFGYQGEFGVMLADSYNNTAFSILSAAIASDGSYDQAATLSAFPNNVVGTFDISSVPAVDPLGFGPNASNFASPPYMGTWGSPAAALSPTKLFVPLKRNNYYVDGAEREKLAGDVGQVIDVNGDVFWTGTVTNINPVPAAFPAGHVEMTYSIPLNLSNSGLKPGKTLVVQSLGHGGTLVDYGRFIIKHVSFVGCAPDFTTDITVYDAVHATGTSPYATLPLNSVVAVYFDASSVSFNNETATDISLSSSPSFKRHFEVYVKSDGSTFTHERARANISGSTITLNGAIPLYSNSNLGKINIIKVSPKMRGYQFGSVSKITLHIADYNDTTGSFSGYLSHFDGTFHLTYGALTFGKKGEVTRFYDETNVDYIDVVFDINDTISSFSNQNMDIQLFPTLSLDDQIMLVGTCQLNDVTKKVNYIRDARQFGNISEKDLSTSALNLISLPEKLLHSNGVVRGFDLVNSSSITLNNEIKLQGGQVLVDGKLIQVNNERVLLPIVQELYSAAYYNINWAICINSKGEYQPIPLLDYDTALGTPNNPTRIMRVFNPANGSTYAIDASTFSDIVNKRKDLTILYLAAATVTPSPLPATISIDLTDARKFINDADGNFPLKLTSGLAQGNFRNPVSIINWIKYNNAFNSTANVNGATTVTGTISIPVVFDFGHSTIIEGENNAHLTMQGNVVLGSNITFRNLRIDFDGGFRVMPGASNVIFDHCEIHITPPNGPTDGVAFDFNGGSNVLFKDCNIYVTYPGPIAWGGSVFRVDNTANFKYEGNYLDMTYTYTPGESLPGQIFVLRTTDKVIISDSVFTGNFAQFLVDMASNNLTIKNVDITTIYDPSAGPAHFFSDPTNGMPYDVLFDTTNIVNSGRGFIYSNVDTIQDNIIIENCTFNYNPVNSSSYRLSFINFDLSSNTSVLSNVKINNCRFNNLNPSIEDIVPAVAIINKASVVLTTQPQPIISNVEIAHNVCNRNQSIIVTSTVVSGKMLYPGLVSQGCNIHDNTCGTIGYFTSGETKFVNTVPNMNSFTDKLSGLTIENNLCHYISNLDHTGKYFYLTKLQHFAFGSDRTVDMCDYATGFVTIRNNKTNWIHVGNTANRNSHMVIENNSLCAYDLSYIALYNDIPGVGYAFSNEYAIVVGSNIHIAATSSSDVDSPDGSCVITGNSVNLGEWLQTTGTVVTYRYNSGYIFSPGSCVITNNKLQGAEEKFVGGFPVGVLIFVAGTNNTITNNRIYRNGKTVLCYVGFGSVDTPAWDGATSKGIVADNFFDSPWTTDVVHNDFTEFPVTINVLGSPKASRWIIERNLNQTGWMSIPITNSDMFLYDGYGFAFSSPYGPSFYVSNAPGINQVGSNIIGFYKSQVLHIHDQDTPALRLLGWQENLDKYMPLNTRIIKVEMGIRPFSSIVDAALSQVMLSLNRYTNSVDYTNLDYFTAPLTGSPPYGTGIKDSKILNDANPQYALITGPQINSTTYTIPAIIDTTTAGPSGSDISDQFTTGRASPISITLDIQLKRDALAVLDLYFSPLLVKYRW